MVEAKAQIIKTTMTRGEKKSAQRGNSSNLTFIVFLFDWISFSFVDYLALYDVLDITSRCNSQRKEHKDRRWIKMPGVYLSAGDDWTAIGLVTMKEKPQNEKVSRNVMCDESLLWHGTKIKILFWFVQSLLITAPDDVTGIQLTNHTEASRPSDTFRRGWSISGEGNRALDDSSHPEEI